MLVLAMAVVLSIPRTYSQESTESPAQHPARDPVHTQAQFQTVVSRLDTGGDLLVVANMEDILEQFISDIIQGASLVEAADPNQTALKSTLTKLHAFLRKNGFYAINGYGISVVPRADGLNTVKSFVSRDASAAGLPLWRGLVGTRPRRLASTDFLPADTVMARVMNGDLSQIWKLITLGVKDVASPKVVASFDKFLLKASRRLGIDVDALLESLADESFISVQFARETKITLPSPGEPLSMPTPSILLGVAVKDNTLSRVIESKLVNPAGGGIPMLPVVKTQMGDTLLQTVNLPLPLPFPFQPTFATHSGYFLIGSNPDVIKKAISAFQEKSGLVADPEFKKAFEGLPMVNNGVIYMSPRFMEVVADIQTRALSATPRGRLQNTAVIKALSSLMNKKGNQSGAFVILNEDSGVLTTGTSASSGKEIVASTLMMPVGMMAALAIPSFTKARGTSQKNACINNLRMIDAAKEQWALANNKADGAAVNDQDIREYLRGQKLPTCPQGGTYTIDAVGLSPRCSIQSHRLRNL